MKQVHAPASRAGNPFSPRPATARRDPEGRRKGVDSHGSTKGKAGTAPPLRALKRPGSRINSASGIVCALLCSLGFSLAIAAGPVCGQSVSLYDNLNSDRDADPNAGRWRFWATLPTEIHSQPFLTVDSDNVSSITLDVMRIGNPRGEMHVEIWDDGERGNPGELVGVVGSLDLAEVGELNRNWQGRRATEWEFITLQNKVTGFTPNTKYHLVFIFTDTTVSENNSVLFGGTASAQGTGGAGLLLLKFSATVWREARSVFNPNFAYLHVAITADGSSAPAAFVRSDSNADRVTDLSDALFTLSWLFLNGPVPPCLAAANVNGDDSVDIADATQLLNHLFSGGPAPLAPFPDCGPGTLPADKELGCANPPDCQ